jgi:hypothetical protein
MAVERTLGYADTIIGKERDFIRQVVPLKHFHFDICLTLGSDYKIAEPSEPFIVVYLILIETNGTDLIIR